MNDSFVALFDFFLDLHVWNILNIFKINVCLLDCDELILEEDNMVAVVLRFALVTAGHLALVAGEHDLATMMQCAVRLGCGSVLAMLRLLR